MLTALASIILSLASPGPFRTERVRVDLSAGTAELRLPPSSSAEFIRLEVEGAAPAGVSLNGAAVSKTVNSGVPEWDLTGAFRFGSPNVLRVGGAPGTVWLVHGPRVFLACGRFSAPTVTICVRNTLDNTVNVDLELTLAAAGAAAPEWKAETSVTVPPATLLPLEFSTPFHHPAWRLKTVLFKHTESVEGDYQVEETVTQK